MCIIVIDDLGEPSGRLADTLKVMREIAKTAAGK
jgi:hypothetical protein